MGFFIIFQVFTIENKIDFNLGLTQTTVCSVKCLLTVTEHTTRLHDISFIIVVKRRRSAREKRMKRKNSQQQITQNKIKH